MGQDNIPKFSEFFKCSFSFYIPPFSFSQLFSKVLLLHLLPSCCVGIHYERKPTVKNIPCFVAAVTIVMSFGAFVSTALLLIIFTWLLFVECSAAVRGESRKGVYVRLRKWKWSSQPGPRGMQNCSLLGERIIALYGLLMGKESEFIWRHVAAASKGKSSFLFYDQLWRRNIDDLISNK